jgi:hypothetical protein
MKKHPSHRDFSLSKSALLLSGCVTWAHPSSPHYEDKYANTEKRDKGTEFHERIHNYAAGRMGMRLASGACPSPEMQSWLVGAATFLDKNLLLRTDSLSTEVCVGVNWSSREAEVLPAVQGRQYPDRPGWVYGTADIVCTLKSGTLLIADWKTGGTNGAKEQLLSLAWAFRKAMGHTGPVAIACLRVFEGGVDPDERVVPDDELEAHADAMQWALELADKKPEPVFGIHCTQLYCPHLAYCGKVTGLVDDAAEGDKGLLPTSRLVRKYAMTHQPSSDEHAGYVMERVTAAKRQLDYYANAMKDYCKNGGRVLSGGYEWSGGKDGFRWRKAK